MNLARPLTTEVLLRPVELSDAAAFCTAQWRSREQLAPWEPRRPPEWYEPDFQTARFEDLLSRENTIPWVLVAGDRLIGTATLSNIVAGALRSGDLGYWIEASNVGRGLASAAVATVCEIADADLLLHRIAASTNAENTASQRVLTKNNFEQYGLARNYLHINNAWRDSTLYHRILNNRAPGEPPS
ncbi:GNAT family N-acetyltransferase [Kribbella sp. CA-294648]|uniref:GNAT family N-acetyltransferase n=1 Tax=Kribbella sp. CA-294648 TaxID=3239948 RepID=UPI003D93A33F